MPTVTIPKKEYQELVEKKFRFEYLYEIMKEDIFIPPFIRNIKEILRAMSLTKRYNKKFLQSLEKGLKRSDYFKI